MPDPLAFVCVSWIKPLAKRLQRIWAKRDAEFEAMYNALGDPSPLADCCIEPSLQHHNLADRPEGEPSRAFLQMPAFAAINRSTTTKWIPT